MSKRQLLMGRLHTVVQYIGLLVLVAGATGWAQKPPVIMLSRSYGLEVVNPTVSQKGGVLSVSGFVRISNPWAETTWGYLELSLLDEKGYTIKKVRVDYFPKPVARTRHGSNEARAFFAVNLDVGNQVVASIRIVYHN